jgi:hypothetical protein
MEIYPIGNKHHTKVMLDANVSRSNCAEPQPELRENQYGSINGDGKSFIQPRQK